VVVLLAGVGGVVGAGPGGGAGGGVEVDLPVVLVDELVVEPAGEDQVGEIGGSAVVPGVEVVGVAVRRGGGASGEDASAVAVLQGASLRGRRVADGATGIQGDTEVVDDDGVQGRVAQQGADGAVLKTDTGGGVGGLGVGGFDDEGDFDVGGAPAHFDERVGQQFLAGGDPVGGIQGVEVVVVGPEPVRDRVEGLFGELPVGVAEDTAEAEPAVAGAGEP
jgi:hypothetical protein